MVKTLIESLEYSRDIFCGIGTRKVKLFLNSLIKKGDKIAKLYRTILELQEANILAKLYFGKWRREYYDKKEYLISSLVSLCKDISDVNYGFTVEHTRVTDHIIYFDLPGCEQISYHCNLSPSQLKSIPEYNGVWDGQEDNALAKIESAIMGRYGAVLKKKYGDDNCYLALQADCA